MNNNMLLQEQLQLHFGDTYPNVVSQTVRFCKTVVNKPWWGQNRTLLLNNEGGMAGMRQSALCYIIEQQDDVTSGLKAYGQYLRSEYGLDKTHTPLEELVGSADFNEIYVRPEVTSDSDVRIEFPQHGVEGQSSNRLEGCQTDRPEADLQSLYGLLHECLVTGLEAEFFHTYASVQDVRESAALCAIPIDTAWRVYKRVMERAARRNMRP